MSALMSLLAAGTMLAACPIADARYQLRDDPTVTTRFYPVARSADWSTGLALGVHFARSGRSYWFLPWQGGTDGRTNLAWVREKRSPMPAQQARRDLQFFTTDAEYRIDPAVPRSDQLAPAHLFLPDLGDLTWHATTGPDRDGATRAFFDLVDCDRQAPDAVPEIEFPAIP